MGIGVIIGVSIGFVFAPISAITYIVPRFVKNQINFSSKSEILSVF